MPPAQIRTCGFPASGSHLGYVTAKWVTTFRMRSSACGTRSPALSLVRALLARIPLGPRPSLHRLRCVRFPCRSCHRWSFRFVRRLRCYYGGVRLLGSVHHRLRLLTFPMRATTGVPLRSNPRSPSFRCDPFARDVALDPDRASAPRIAVPHMLPSSERKPSAPAMSDLSWLNPTPHAIAVYASRPLSPGATQHSLPSGRYSLLEPDLHRLDRTSLRLAHSFNHLVGRKQELRRDFQAKGLGRLTVDDELEFGRL